MYSQLFNKLFNFIFYISTKYKIDESHDVSHSMNVIHTSNEIYESELYLDPDLKKFEKTIYISALLHDMCDKKYMNENEGIENIKKYLKNDITDYELKNILTIISTMSYSTIKKNGFPKLDFNEKVFHIVREADLLTSYDFDRSMIYDMRVKGNNFEKSFNNSVDLFNNRVFTYGKDNLFITDYSKKIYPSLESNAIQRINSWKRILKLK